MISLINRQATFIYFIEDKFEAGLQLLGTEVKSLREGKASFNEAYCLLEEGEVWIKSLHIAPYSHGSHANHDPIRTRKLLLQKKEIKKIESRLKEKGYTVVPLKIFFSSKGFAKVVIGLARGKKQADKKESLKKKQAEREMKKDLSD
jgi:SsrA-binding protein